VDPNERIWYCPRKDASEFMMLYECLFLDIRLHFPFSDFQVDILNCNTKILGSSLFSRKKDNGRQNLIYIYIYIKVFYLQSRESISPAR
jgi:hypothetical protein